MQIFKTTWNYQVGLIEFDMYDRYGTPMRMYVQEACIDAYTRSVDYLRPYLSSSEEH